MKPPSLRPSLAIVLPALAAVFVTGCFNSPDKSKLSCTTNDYCPHGEVCLGAHGLVPGMCGTPIDGGGVDASPALDGAAASEAGANDRGSSEASPAADGPSASETGGVLLDSGNDPGATDTTLSPDDISSVDGSDAPLNSSNDGGAIDQAGTDGKDGSLSSPDVVAPADSPILIPEVGGGCTSSTDCPGSCQSCSSGHVCVAIIGQDDPTGRCAGTCDATGACKSKKGQTCQTVPGGRASGTTCAPDGICCDTTCSGSCQACDIPGFLGTCTPVASGNPHGNRTSCGTDATCAGTCAGKADGTCSYPTKNCGAGSSCSGIDKVIAQSTCASGTCQTPTAQPCQGGFACASGACNTTCTTSADCTAGNYCNGSACAAKKANGQPCTSATASTCSSGICGGVAGVCCYADCGLCGGCSRSGVSCDWTAAGQSCGTNAVCNSSHACVACESDAACVSSSNECRDGTIDCFTGVPTCAHLGDVTEGTTCNAGAGYCHTGSCTAKVGPGANCSDDFDCISGQCVSGACF